MITSTKLLLILTFIYAGTGNCCLYPSRQISQPKHPDNVRGWKDTEVNGVHVIAELVLRKNESSDNGNIGIEVVDILPPEQCVEPNSSLGQPRVVLRFYHPSDRKVLCEDTFRVASARLDSSPCNLAGKSGMMVINVRAVNTMDEWVWLDLMD